MITGLAALAQKSYAPDKGNGPRVRPNGGDGKGNNSGKDDAAGDRLPAFMPGQQAALADQLATGFGGNDAQWREYLGKVYSPLMLQSFTPMAHAGDGNGHANPNGLPITYGGTTGGVQFGPDGQMLPPGHYPGQNKPQNVKGRIPNVVGYPEIAGLVALRGGR